MQILCETWVIQCNSAERRASGYSFAGPSGAAEMPLQGIERQIFVELGLQAVCRNVPSFDGARKKGNQRIDMTRGTGSPLHLLGGHVLGKVLLSQVPGERRDPGFHLQMLLNSP